MTFYGEAIGIHNVHVLAGLVNQWDLNNGVYSRDDGYTVTLNAGDFVQLDFNWWDGANLLTVNDPVTALTWILRCSGTASIAVSDARDPNWGTNATFSSLPTVSIDNSVISDVIFDATTALRETTLFTDGNDLVQLKIMVTSGSLVLDQVRLQIGPVSASDGSWSAWQEGIFNSFAVSPTVSHSTTKQQISLYKSITEIVDDTFLFDSMRSWLLAGVSSAGEYNSIATIYMYDVKTMTGLGNTNPDLNTYRADLVMILNQTYYAYNATTLWSYYKNQRTSYPNPLLALNSKVDFGPRPGYTSNDEGYYVEYENALPNNAIGWENWAPTAHIEGSTARTMGYGTNPVDTPTALPLPVRFALAAASLDTTVWQPLGVGATVAEVSTPLISSALANSVTATPVDKVLNISSLGSDLAWTLVMQPTSIWDSFFIAAPITYERWNTFQNLTAQVWLRGTSDPWRTLQDYDYNNTAPKFRHQTARWRYWIPGGTPLPMRQRQRDDGLATDTRQEKGHGSSLQSSLRKSSRTYY